MRVQATVIKTGNSWGIRLPKTAVALSGLKTGEKLDLEVRPGRLILRRNKPMDSHKLDQAYEDVKIVWDQALKDAWFQAFRPDYDS
jgi:antitoxin component of MazEF toxin-antitoxin module